MAAPAFQLRVPAHYLSQYVDIRRVKKKLESLVQRAQQQRATVRRRLDILQRPRMLPHGAKRGKLQKQASPAVSGDPQDADASASITTPTACTLSRQELSSAAVPARADDGMAGSSLRAEAETLSLLPEAQFWELLQQQVQNLNKFATGKERQIQSDLRTIAARMEQLTELRGDEELLIEEQAAEIIHLDLYIRTNHKALLALCSHFDRLLTGAKTARWFSTSLLKEAYCNVDLERLVLMLSLLWGKFRVKREGRQAGSEAWKPPDSFVRTTTKYWIRPENIVRAQCLIVRHLPFLVFGTSDKDLEASLLGLAASKEGRDVCPSNVAPTQMVASVYFDNAEAYSYERRIRRFEGAQLLRFRWYGTNNNGPEEEIFVERKTHHESWSGVSSTKERFVIPQRLVAPYMLLQRSARDLLLEASGFHPPAQADGSTTGESADTSCPRTPVVRASSAVTQEEVEKAAAAFIAKDKKLRNAITLGTEIQGEIEEHRLQPMLRTSYLRAAFQLATSNDVRISLDTNLCMVNEYRHHKQDDAGFNWCRLADELLGKDEVVRFPYAILEVKVQQQPPPPWVESMLLLSSATMVYKFSKFQHGMAFLHRDKISSGLLPHWLRSRRPPHQGPQHSPQWQPPGCGPSQLGVSLFESLRNSADSLLTPLVRTFADNRQQSHSAAGAMGRKRRPLIPLREAPFLNMDGEWESITDTLAHRTYLWLQAEQGLQMQQAASPTCNDGNAGLPERVGPEANSTNSADSLRQRLVRRNIRTVRKIDPKTSFAGERTFLHYIQKALYLAGASLACLETLAGGWGLGIALTLGGSCIVLCCGAYAIYVKRCRRIARRVAKAGAANVRQRIDSRWGPWLAFFAAGLATLLVLLLQVDINFKHVLKREQEEHRALFKGGQQRALQYLPPYVSDV